MSTTMETWTQYGRSLLRHVNRSQIGTFFVFFVGHFGFVKRN